MTERLRLLRRSPHTIEVYAAWVRRYVRFHRRRHPRTMGEREVTAFLSSLATERRVAASTQNQALAALLFLYRDVLDAPVGWLQGLARAKRPHRVPTVLSRDEVRRLIDALPHPTSLVGRVMYGGGLRLGEALRLRVKDVDFDRGELIVRLGKGGRDRVTMLPASLAEAMRAQIGKVRELHRRDRKVANRPLLLPNAGFLVAAAARPRSM